jgi:hypothetical protein
VLHRHQHGQDSSDSQLFLLAWYFARQTLDEYAEAPVGGHADGATAHSHPCAGLADSPALIWALSVEIGQEGKGMSALKEALKFLGLEEARTLLAFRGGFTWQGPGKSTVSSPR